MQLKKYKCYFIRIYSRFYGVAKKKKYWCLLKFSVAVSYKSHQGATHGSLIRKITSWCLREAYNLNFDMLLLLFISTN